MLQNYGDTGPTSSTVADPYTVVRERRPRSLEVRMLLACQSLFQCSESSQCGDFCAFAGTSQFATEADESVRCALGTCRGLENTKNKKQLDD
jgi:hypothetical protein